MNSNTKKISWLIMTGTILILLSGCGKDKPLPGGYQQLIGTKEGESIDTVLVQEIGTEQFYTELVNTSESSELLFGNYQEYRTGIFFEFGALPDTVNVHSAELILQVKDRLAPGDSTYWDITRQATAKLFLADTNWTIETPPDPTEELLLASYPLLSDSVNEIAIPLDTTLVNQWIAEDSPYQDYGIWMESPDAEYMPVFYSYESLDFSVMPRLKLIFSYTDSTGSHQDTVSYYVSEDQFLILSGEQELNLDPDLFYIGKGVAFRSLIKFNFQLLDTTAHVNRALLKLTINCANSIRDKYGANECIIYRLTEPWVQSSIPDDQETVSYMATLEDSTLTFDITPTIQAWLNNNYENYGFLVKSLGEGHTIGRVAFYSSTSDSVFQPKIYLYYTLPSEQEF